MSLSVCDLLNFSNPEVALPCHLWHIPISSNAIQSNVIAFPSSFTLLISHNVSQTLDHTSCPRKTRPTPQHLLCKKGTTRLTRNHVWLISSFVSKIKGIVRDYQAFLSLMYVSILTCLSKTTLLKFTIVSRICHLTVFPLPCLSLPMRLVFYTGARIHVQQCMRELQTQVSQPDKRLALRPLLYALYTLWLACLYDPCTTEAR
jgi:hypothetical protein